jgi:hypothetical protein
MSRRRGTLTHPRLIWDGRRPWRLRRPSSCPGEVFPRRRFRLAVRAAPIQGDNLGVMASLLPTYEGRFDLIYADPPFLTGKAFRARVGRGEDSRSPLEWQTIDGYMDRWGSPAEYLSMLEPRLRLMYRLLSPSGSLYLHLDWHAAARAVVDEIFARSPSERNRWVYRAVPGPEGVQPQHDTPWSTRRQTHTLSTDAAHAIRRPHCALAGSRASARSRPRARKCRKTGGTSRWLPGCITSGRATPPQKPEALLTRVIAAYQPARRPVGDFFCGSGTALVAVSGPRRMGCDAHRWPATSPIANCCSSRVPAVPVRSTAYRMWSRATICAAIEVNGPEAAVRRGCRVASGELPVRTPSSSGGRLELRRLLFRPRQARLEKPRASIGSCPLQRMGTQRGGSGRRPERRVRGCRPDARAAERLRSRTRSGRTNGAPLGPLLNRFEARQRPPRPPSVGTSSR